MSARDVAGIGLVGFGNIGREVYSYFRTGRDGARVVAIARRRPRSAAPAAVRRLLARSAGELVANPRVDVVVELTGDADGGARLMLEAIAAGKHVVTGNKEALAKHWPALVGAARERGVTLGFEATVGGGMPVVRTMQRHISGDEVEHFAGILNGTCNYILARMQEYIVANLDHPAIQRLALPMEEALAQAQALGFAEPDPTNDIAGFDTRYKVAILANLAFDTFVDPAAIPCEGIWEPRQRIMPSDLYFLHHPRYLNGKFALKLVGVAERRAGPPALRVHPALIDRAGPLADLAGIDETYNGIVVRSRRLGTQFLKGLGAGPAPTTVSIAADVREIAASIASGAQARGRAGGPRARPAALGDVRSVPTRGYIRSFSPDVRGIYAKKLEVLARHRVNVQSVVNVREFVYGRDRLMPDYIEVDETPDGAVGRVLDDFRRMRDVRDPMYFRVLEL